MPKRGDENPNPDLTWRTLADFSLPSVAGSEREALERVAGAMPELRLSSARLEELESALVEAVLKAIEDVADGQPELLARVRVLVLASQPVVMKGQGEVARLLDSRDFGSSPNHPHLSAGWSFFLVEKMTDNLDSGDGPVRYTVDLFIYPEGD